MTTGYAEFLERKTQLDGFDGFEPTWMPDFLFGFQTALVEWAIRKGRGAIFADCGLGKTPMQLVWAENVRRHTGKPVLIVTPLAVGFQTKGEAAKFGIDADTSKTGHLTSGITITNYERLHLFDPAELGGMVCDESSAIKSFNGVHRALVTDYMRKMRYRLLCTATAAPNDYIELGTSSEALGYLGHMDMLNRFFRNENNTSDTKGRWRGYGAPRAFMGQQWRFKGHAEEAFWRWVCSWARSVRRPSDLGFEDDGFILPPLDHRQHIIEARTRPEGTLFEFPALGIHEERDEQRRTINERCEAVADLLADAKSAVAWCHLNAEGDLLTKIIPGAVQVSGSDDSDRKEEALLAFSRGDIRVLVTKPKIGAWGLNWQHAHRMTFFPSHSYEQYYQAIRRMWRFGQTEKVEAVVVLSDAEAAIYENVMRKETEAKRMQERLIEHVAAFEKDELEGMPDQFTYETAETNGNGWRVMLGDSVERLREVPDGSVDLSVFSPPFESLFTYSPTERDLGNSASTAQFWTHFRYIIRELLRVTKPGRNVAVHCMAIPTTVARDGFTGVRDFRGDIIRGFVDEGWTFHGEVTIDKDPQAQAIRTKSKGLLFVQKDRDRGWLRPALADYIVAFRKPGENAEPIRSDEVSNDDWIEWARPIWYGIRESATLNAAEAREQADERHIAALQLETVRRCILLWSNAGDVVLDPFTGIGTTGYVAVQNGRRFVGCELKRSYYEAACRNITRATNIQTLGLLDSVPESA